MSECAKWQADTYMYVNKYLHIPRSRLWPCPLHNLMTKWLATGQVNEGWLKFVCLSAHKYSEQLTDGQSGSNDWNMFYSFSIGNVCTSVVRADMQVIFRHMYVHVKSWNVCKELRWWVSPSDPVHFARMYVGFLTCLHASIKSPSFSTSFLPLYKFVKINSHYWWLHLLNFCSLYTYVYKRVFACVNNCWLWWLEGSDFTGGNPWFKVGSH